MIEEPRAVVQVVLDDGTRLLDHVAVARAQTREPQLLEPVQRGEVLRHVATAARAHDRDDAVEHGVAREERPLLLEQEAEMVRRVTGRVEHLQAELGALDRVAVADDAIGHDVGVLVEALAVREHLGRPSPSRGARRPGVVGMRVGEQHPPHPFAHRCADDGVDVRSVVGAGVDHRDLVDADEIRVRCPDR